MGMAGESDTTYGASVSKSVADVAATLSDRVGRCEAHLMCESGAVVELPATPSFPSTAEAPMVGMNVFQAPTSPRHQSLLSRRLESPSLQAAEVFTGATVFLPASMPALASPLSSSPAVPPCRPTSLPALGSLDKASPTLPSRQTPLPVNESVALASCSAQVSSEGEDGDCTHVDYRDGGPIVREEVVSSVVYAGGDPWEGCEELAHEDLAEWLIDFMRQAGSERTPEVHEIGALADDDADGSNDNVPHEEQTRLLVQDTVTTSVGDIGSHSARATTQQTGISIYAGVVGAGEAFNDNTCIVHANNCGFAISQAGHPSWRGWGGAVAETSVASSDIYPEKKFAGAVSAARPTMETVSTSSTLAGGALACVIGAAALKPPNTWPQHTQQTVEIADLPASRMFLRGWGATTGQAGLASLADAPHLANTIVPHSVTCASAFAAPGGIRGWGADSGDQHSLTARSPGGLAPLGATLCFSPRSVPRSPAEVVTACGESESFPVTPAAEACKAE